MIALNSIEYLDHVELRRDRDSGLWTAGIWIAVDTGGRGGASRREGTGVGDTIEQAVERAVEQVNSGMEDAP